jgi:16S rRNA (guanine966-N2)-methyltransferase
MRIISGRYKRRVISPPTNLPVRPTTDMAKESLFNILGNYIDFDGKSALDLYAGTGNISYEFVSRGCKSVVAVDHDFGCIKFINKTAQQLEMNELNIMKMDVLRFIQTTKFKYDIIFTDPPYKLSNTNEIIKAVFDNELLNPGAWMIVEHDANKDFSGLLHFYEHRKYGRVNFSFFHIEV